MLATDKEGAIPGREGGSEIPESLYFNFQDWRAPLILSEEVRPAPRKRFRKLNATK